MDNSGDSKPIPAQLMGEVGSIGMSSEDINVTMPGKDQQIAIHVVPGQKIDIQGVDPAKLAITILGADVVISDPLSNAKIVFLGLGLILFSPQETPHIALNGDEFTPNELLSRVGLIRNITQKDFLSFTSLNLEDMQHKQESKKEDPDVELTITKIQEVIVDITPKKAFAFELQEDANDYQLTSQPRPDFVSDSEGVPEQDVPLHHKKSSQSSSASQTQTETESHTADAPPEPTSARTTFDFDVRLLQLGLTSSDSDSDSLDDTFYGGGGLSAAVYNPSNTIQAASEIIDLVSNTEFQIIYADDPSVFTDTQAARSLQFSPNLPDAFELSGVVITGLPAGVTIDGATFDGTSYTLESADIVFDARGDINLPLIFATNSGPSTFTATITATATYNPALDDVGATPPASTELEYVLDQKFEIKEALDASDLNYTDSDGDVVFVLSTAQNGNRILTGNGGSEVHGSTASDTVVGGSGNDLVIGGGDDDILDGGGGLNDTISFADKVVGQDVVINLAGSTNADGYASATIGSETDLHKNFEHVLGGAGDDTISGSTGVNTLTGGDGDDTINGNIGDDILIGGLGSDTIDYSYITYDAGSIQLSINLDGVDGSGNISVNFSYWWGDPAETDIINGFENIIATDDNDSIRGSDSSDNVIDARAGDDTLTFTLGNDTYDGGSGTDTISYQGHSVGIIVNLSDTPDTDGYIHLTSGSKTDRIKNIETIFGTGFVDVMTGDGNAQTFRGENGNDVLNGMGGDDLLYGGFGNDTLDGGSGSDILGFSDHTGSTSRYVVINLVAGTAFYEGGATDYTDIISNFEVFYGAGSSDGASTNGGSDQFYSASGNYTFHGGASNGASNHGDIVSYQNDTGDGYITVTLSSTAGSGSVVKTSSGGTGWTGTDTFYTMEKLVATSNNDTVYGGAGSYRLLDGGAGSADVLDYSTFTTGVVLYASGVTNKSGAWAGTDDFTNFESFVGSNSASDEFYSGEGFNFTFNGGSGAGITDLIDYFSFGSFITVDVGSGTVVKSGGGTDTLISIENIRGTSGNDVFTASTGTYTLQGHTGTDSVSYASLGGVITTTTTLSTSVANSGTVVKSGGNGTDTLLTMETLTLTGNNDIVYSGIGSYTIQAGGGTNTLSYISADAGVSINVGTGVVTKSGTWVGGTDTTTGFSEFVGSTLNDNFTATATGNYFLYGQAGTDTVTYAGQAAITYDVLNSTVTKSGGTDVLIDMEDITGTSNNDTVYGYDGSITFHGGLGTDILNYDTNGGGNENFQVNLSTTLANSGSVVKYGDWSGNDTFDSVESIRLGNNNDVVYGGTGTYTIDADSGSDTLTYTWAPVPVGGVVDINVATGVVTKSGVAGWSGTDTTSGFETFIGSAGNDSFTARSSGSYTLNGGSAGTDTVTYAGQGAIYVDLTTPTATVTKSSGGIDALTSIEDITGTDNGDTFLATTTGHTFRGGLGTDTVSYSSFAGTISATLNGGGATITKSTGSPDTLTSIENYTLSSGNDTITVGDSTSSYTVNASNGTDTVNYSALASAVNANLVTGTIIKASATDYITNAEHFTGGGGDDTITGTTGGNTLNGGNGNDTIYGGDGNDSLSGDAGNDIIYGGSGSSNVYVGTGADDVRGGSGTELMNAGEDTVADYFDGGGGTDQLQYSGLSASYHLTIDLTGAQTSTTSHAGNTYYGINVQNASNTTVYTDYVLNTENLIGSGQNDTFYGDNGANQFEGWGGNDTFVGRGGNDSFYGGTSSVGAITGDTDTADYSSIAAHTLTITANDGASSLSVVGASTGTDTLYDTEVVRGGSLNDSFTGLNGKNETFYGNGGADTFIVNGGSNTYNGGSGTDIISYAGATATNVGVTGSVAGASLNATLNTQTTAGVTIFDTLYDIETFTMSDYNDVITFDADAVTGLVGAGGTMNFGTGTDKLVIQSGSDISTFNGVNFDSIFNNVEEIDMRGVSDSGTFTLTNTDIAGLRGSGAFTLRVSDGFSLNGSTLHAGDTSASYDIGGQTVNLVVT